ncbi:MAG: hypothetical protein NZ519_10910 [Bacteroidia bacterium]|nr:hypothetical protein [Bacteroidia bacterium]MDW8302290.1 hypothetical protein [Bacteroidia bacterium]
MLHKKLLAWILCVFSSSLLAQTDMSYLEYLYNQKEYALLQYEIEQIYKNKTELSTKEWHRISFWQYSIGDTSGNYAIPFFEKALQVKKLHSFGGSPSSEYELLLQYISQAYCIRRRETLRPSPIYKDTVLQKYHSQLQQLVQKYAFSTHKSPILAGFFSAVIPGLGKVYSGSPVQMIVPLFSTISFAAQAVEIALKSGYKTPIFWIPVSLGAIFYLSNIYGSAEAAKQYNSKQKKNYYAELDALLDSVVAYYAYRE